MIKEIYDLDKIQEKFKDGTVAYPLEENPLENGHCGAQIEFRCVLLYIFLLPRCLLTLFLQKRLVRIP